VNNKVAEAKQLELAIKMHRYETKCALKMQLSVVGYDITPAGEANFTAGARTK